MSQKFSLDGEEYDISTLSDEGKNLIAALDSVNKQLQYASNMRAILTRAKNSYISELKSEVVKGKTGLDLSDLFSED